MKNNFPRIYSLSTLGIIYHFNTDYRFNSFRTDFSGEGGSGKTMIADMIQLILVGSGVYKSATAGNDPRPVEGMVLQSKSTQYGAGYVFLNIETKPGKFIVIGAFIEKSSRQVKMFIAQDGFDWDRELNPLTKPVSYKDLLVNGRIIPVEELQDEVAHIHIKSLPLKQYHRLLFDNKLLPLDLSRDKRTLENYARILRSFSRGSGFKTDPKSLKDFLFGDDNKSLLAQYNNEVKSINDDNLEHDRYKKEIDLINKKQGSIKDIIDLSNKSNELHRQYLDQKIVYWIHRQRLYEKDFDIAVLSYNELKFKNQCLEIAQVDIELAETSDQFSIYKTSKSHLESIRKRAALVSDLKSEKSEELQVYGSRIEQIKRVEHWLTENENSLAKVSEHYEKEMIYLDDRTLLERFKQYLDSESIKYMFEDSYWLSDFKYAKANYEEEIKQLKTKELELNSILVFANLQNPNSLASWAMNYFDRPLTIEEESILRYFQNFSRTANEIPERVERYLNDPEELFKNIDVHVDLNANGFWINLDGVFEFIEYISKQYLNIDTQEKQKLMNTMATLSQDLQAEIKELQKVIQNNEFLKNKLFSFDSLEKAVSLYLDRTSYKAKPNADYALDKDLFLSYLNTYSNKTQILAEYQLVKSEFEKLILEEKGIDPDDYEGQFRQSSLYFRNLNINPDEADAHADRLSERANMQHKRLSDLQTELGYSDLKSNELRSSLLDHHKTLVAVLKLKTQYAELLFKTESSYNFYLNKLQEVRGNLDSAKLDFRIAFKEEHVGTNQLIEVADPEGGDNSLKGKYDRTLIKFQEKYNLIASELEDYEQLKDTFHIGQLAHKLLPTVFLTAADVNQNQINDKLTERLDKLYQTIKVIGSRKIEILKLVFSEVGRTYREYLMKIEKIDQYFKRPNKRITGGNKGTLKSMPSLDYPARWITVFNRILSDQVNNIGLFEHLTNEIDINEMMMQAFISEGGKKGATIEELLDPKSYFDIKFELRLENGDRNSGSNSQTYAGNALLSLARLSLIEDEEEGIRIMPIDEAQGLGSNYEMLRDIAIEEGYQILTMSIDTAGEIREGEQYIYILSENILMDEDNYVPAMGIFSEGVITKNIEDFIDGQES